MRLSACLFPGAATALVLSIGIVGNSQTPGPGGVPSAVLVEAEPLSLPGAVDSNSPAVWERVRGRNLLFLFTSIAGTPSVSGGFDLTRQAPPRAVTFDPPVSGGAWMEAVFADVDNTWYGFFHNEVMAFECPASGKVLPRIGAARSTDLGRTWTNLGTILEAPTDSYVCATPNTYFVGGVGDLSAVLDAGENYVYIYYGQYARTVGSQGVLVARMPWADRDEPVGKVTVWQDGVWLPPRYVDAVMDDAGAPLTREGWEYPAGTPIYPVTRSWHTSAVDAFWGPSVHWNSYLERYVMLLNRAIDRGWKQEGIYVAYAERLDDPASWSKPQRLMDGGGWYPQVVGLEPLDGTDKEAGEVARFFVNGDSQHLIRFGKPR